MFAYVVRRILATIPVMGVVALFVFLILRVASSDPAAVIAGPYATPADIEAIRKSLGLNEPLHIQFLMWLGDLLRGDLGTSIFTRRPVTEIIAARLEPTLALSISTITLTVLVAVPLGMLAAWKAGGIVDRIVMAISVLAFSFPVFVIGYFLVLVFSLELDLLPVMGYRRISDGLVPFAKHLILPTLTMSLVYVALITRITRASMLEVLNSDYIRTARAKGLPELPILSRHALRSAGVPIATVIGIGFGLLISGVVITESVFAIPGLGRLTADAINNRDFPIIQGVILLFSFVYVLLNLVIDLCYRLIDPRIQY